MAVLVVSAAIQSAEVAEEHAVPGAALHSHDFLAVQVGEWEFVWLVGGGAGEGAGGRALAPGVDLAGKGEGGVVVPPGGD